MSVPGLRKEKDSFASFDNDNAPQQSFQSYPDLRGTDPLKQNRGGEPALTEKQRAQAQAESNRFSVPMNEMQESLMASKRHVFLSWHDVNFTVPVIKGAQGGGVNGRNHRLLLDIDDPRVSMLTSHNKQFGSTKASKLLTQ